MESSEPKTPPSPAYLALWVMFLTWGTGFVAAKMVVAEIPPFTYNVLRYLLCGGLLMAWAFGRGVVFPSWKSAEGRETWGRLAISSALSVFGGNFFVTLGLLSINGGIAPVITSLESSVFLLLCFLQGEKMSRWVWVGMGTGFVGLLVLLSPTLWLYWEGGVLADAREGFGLLMLFCGALCWGCGGYFVRHHPIRMELFTNTALQYLMSCGVFLVLAVLLEEFHPSEYSARAWGAFFYVSLITTLLGYACYMYILGRLPAPVIATKAYALPLISLVTGYVVLGEVLTPIQWVGVLVMLAGITVVNQARKRG
jgi:drug/metabolite transporter (DMT)-like permease